MKDQVLNEIKLNQFFLLEIGRWLHRIVVKSKNPIILRAIFNLIEFDDQRHREIFSELKVKNEPKQKYDFFRNLWIRSYIINFLEKFNEILIIILSNKEKQYIEPYKFIRHEDQINQSGYPDDEDYTELDPEMLSIQKDSYYIYSLINLRKKENAISSPIFSKIEEFIYEIFSEIIYQSPENPQIEIGEE